MYKSTFSVTGYYCICVVIGISAMIVLGAVVMADTLVSNLFNLFLGISAALILLPFLWLMTTPQLNYLTITEHSISVKNVFTRRTKLISTADLKGWKDSFSGGYSLLLIGHSNQVVFRIQEPFYSDFLNLRSSLPLVASLKYLGRKPTFLDRFITIETS